MTGKKKRSSYRKTRKRKGFSGVHISEISAEETVSEGSEIGEMAHSKPGTSEEKISDQESSSAEDNDQPVSASRKKMKLQRVDSSDNSKDDEEEEKETEFNGEGYRLVDMEALSSTLSCVHKCEGGEWW